MSKDDIQTEIQQTRDSLTEKIGLLEHEVQEEIRAGRNKVRGTVQSMRNAVSLEYHVRTKPWLMTGAALLVGYAAASFIKRRVTSNHAAPRQKRQHPERETFPEQRKSSGSRSSGALRELMMTGAGEMLRNSIRSIAPQALQPHIDEAYNKIMNNHREERQRRENAQPNATSEPSSRTAAASPVAPKQPGIGRPLNRHPL